VFDHIVFFIDRVAFSFSAGILGPSHATDVDLFVLQGIAEWEKRPVPTVRRTKDAPGSTLKVGRAAGQQRGLITISGLKPSKRGQKWDSVTRSQMTKHLKGSHTVVRED